MVAIAGSEIHLLEPDTRIGVIALFRNVMIQVWLTQGTLAFHEYLRDQTQAVSERKPNGFVVLQVLPSNADLPPREIIQGAKKLASMTFPPMRALASVVEGQTFA